MGGMIAAEWAHRYPSDLSGIVLINTSFGSISDPWQRLKPEAIVRILKIMKAKVQSQPFNQELEILRMISNQKMSFKKRWAQEFCKLPQPHFLNFSKQLIACARFLGSRQRPAVPSLILASLNDRMVSYRCSEGINSFWKTQFYVHPWAGHDLPFDDSVWTVSKIRTFCEGL
jgi:pimeloyl-ACP methyl ester carboxylesterase